MSTIVASLLQTCNNKTCVSPDVLDHVQTMAGYQTSFQAVDADFKERKVHEQMVNTCNKCVSFYKKVLSCFLLLYGSRV